MAWIGQRGGQSFILENNKRSISWKVLNIHFEIDINNINELNFKKIVFNRFNNTYIFKTFNLRFFTLGLY